MTKNKLTRLNNKIEKALKINPNIRISQDLLEQSPGYPDSYFETLGFTMLDLKLLERKGLAVRGYTQNIWVSSLKETGDDVRKMMKVGPGSRRKWVLILKE